MGGAIERVLMVGCEPTPLNTDDDFGIEMSKPVFDAIDEAVGMVESLVNRLQTNVPVCDSARIEPSPA